MSDAPNEPRSGAQIAEEYGLGEPVPFNEVTFPKGTYALGAAGTVVRVVFWAAEVENETRKDICTTLRWMPGWELSDIVEGDETNGSVYGTEPTAKPVTAGPTGGFKATDGNAWLLTEEKLAELLQPAVEDDPSATADGTRDDSEGDEIGILVPILPSNEDNDDDGSVPLDAEPVPEPEPDIQLHTLSDPEPAADLEPATPEEQVIESGLKTGPMDIPKASPSKVYSLWTLVHRFGPIDWPTLEAWAWETKLLGKTCKTKEQVRSGINKLIEKINGDGWDLRRSHEHEINECVHIGPLPEQTCAGMSSEPAAAWGTLSDYMEGAVSVAVDAARELFSVQADDGIFAEITIVVDGDSITKRA